MSARSEVALQITLAVGELVQAAAHQHGIVGPVEYEVLPCRDVQASAPTTDCSSPAGGNC